MLMEENADFIIFNIDLGHCFASAASKLGLELSALAHVPLASFP